MVKASKPRAPALRPGSTVDPAEVGRFNALAGGWWDPDGPMAPLHAMTPARMGYVRDALCTRFERDPASRTSLTGLSILDIGCGAGLASEPLARLGAQVTGLDAAEDAIAAARDHAAACALTIRYVVGEPETLPSEALLYDAVVALEVLEHVADLPVFLGTCRSLLKPGGLLAFSTLNRTALSWATAIVGAEYLLRMVPRGTHDWRKFLTPDELTAALADAGFKVSDISGLSPDPMRNGWRISRFRPVNYIGWAVPA